MCNFKSLNKSKKGVSLIIAIIITAMLVIFMASLVVVVSININATNSDITKNRAYINAKSALGIAESFYMQSNNLPETSEYFCIVSDDSVVTDVSIASPITIKYNLSDADDFETYVKTDYDSVNGKFTLTAFSKYFTKGMKTKQNKTVTCSYNIGYDADQKITTAVRKINLSDPSRFVTVHVKPYPGAKTDGRELNPPYLYTWAYGTGQEEQQPNVDKEETLLSLGWNGKSFEPGPQCAMYYEGNGWYYYTIQLADEGIKYFNAIIAAKGGIRENGNNWQTSEMFNLPVPLKGGQTEDVYITLNKKDENLTDVRGDDLDGKTAPNSMTQYYTTYVKADFTDVHFRVAEDTNGDKLKNYSVSVKNTDGTSILNSNLLTNLDVENHITPPVYSGGNLIYEGYGWYTIKIPTKSAFNITLKNSTGSSVLTCNNVLGSSENEVWIAIDKALNASVKSSEDTANNTFASWGDATAGQYRTVNVKGLALYAGTPPDVQIKYNVDAGDDTSSKTAIGDYTIKVNYKTNLQASYMRNIGDFFELPNIMDKTGFNFLGWAKSPDSRVGEFQVGEIYTVSAVDDLDNNKIIDFYPIWAEKDIFVIYDANGGTNAPAKASVTTQNPIRISNVAGMKKTGYNFLGWSTNPNATQPEELYKPDTEITVNNVCFNTSKELKLYAVWERMTDIYVVKYDLNGGSGTAPQNIVLPQYGTELERTFVVQNGRPWKTGASLLGWSTNQSATTADYVSGDRVVVDGDITLYAIWETKTYTLTYNANGGQGAPLQVTNKKIGDKVMISDVIPTKTGKAFKGWAKSATATIGKYNGGDEFTIKGDSILYAVWGEDDGAIYIETVKDSLAVYMWREDPLEQPFGTWNNNTTDKMTFVGITENNKRLYKIDLPNNLNGEYQFKFKWINGNNKPYGDYICYISAGEINLYKENNEGNSIENAQGTSTTRSDMNNLLKNAQGTAFKDEYTIKPLEFSKNSKPSFSSLSTSSIVTSVFKDAFSNIFNIFNFNKNTISLNTNNKENTFSKDNAVSTKETKTLISNSNLNIAPMVNSNNEETSKQFSGGDYLYFDLSDCENWVFNHSAIPAVKFNGGTSGLVDYTSTTEVESKKIYKILIPNGDYNNFSVARYANGGYHNVINDISLADYDKNTKNCYKIKWGFVSEGWTNYNDTGGGGTNPPISGTYGSMANRSGEKTQYYNVYMSKYKDANGVYQSHSYGYYGFETTRAGNSKTAKYNEWYTFKIPSVTEYDVQFKGLHNNTVETVQLSDLTEDTWITLDGDNTTGGKYNDLSIYTFDPDENYARGSTTVYFKKPSNWSGNVYACTWGLNQKNWGNSTQLSSFVDNGVTYYKFDLLSSTPYIVFHNNLGSESSAMKTDVVTLDGIPDKVLYDATTNSWKTYIHPEVALERAVSNARGVMNRSIMYKDVNGGLSNTPCAGIKKVYTEGKNFSGSLEAKKIRAQYIDDYSSAVSTMCDYIREARSYISGYYEYAKYSDTSIQYTAESLQNLKDVLNSTMVVYNNESATIDNINSMSVQLRRAMDFGLEPILTGSDPTVVDPTDSQAIVVLQDKAHWTQNESILCGVTGIIYKENLTSGLQENVINFNETIEYINNQGYYLYYITFDSGRDTADIGFTPPGQQSIYSANILNGIRAGDVWIYNNEDNTWRQNNEDGMRTVNTKKITGNVGSQKIYTPQAGHTDFTLYFNYDTTVKYGNRSYVVFAGAYTIRKSDFPNGINLFSPRAKAYLTNPINFGQGDILNTYGNDWTNNGTINNNTSYHSMPTRFLVGATLDNSTSSLQPLDQYSDASASSDYELANTGYNHTLRTADNSTFATNPTYSAPEILFRWAKNDPLVVSNKNINLSSKKITFAGNDLTFNLNNRGVPKGTFKIGDGTSSNIYNEVLFLTDVNVIVYNSNGSINKSKSFVIYNGKYKIKGSIDLYEFNNKLNNASGDVISLDSTVLSGGVYK